MVQDSQSLEELDLHPRSSRVVLGNEDVPATKYLIETSPSTLKKISLLGNEFDNNAAEQLVSAARARESPLSLCGPTLEASMTEFDFAGFSRGALGPADRIFMAYDGVGLKSLVKLNLSGNTKIPDWFTLEELSGSMTMTDLNMNGCKTLRGACCLKIAL